MALTVEQLFCVFAARAAEILRERFGMDPQVTLRVTHDRRAVEGLVRSSQEGGPQWYRFEPTSEQLQWMGPDVTADAFVRELSVRRANAR